MSQRVDLCLAPAQSDHLLLAVLGLYQLAASVQIVARRRTTRRLIAGRVGVAQHLHGRLPQPLEREHPLADWSTPSRTATRLIRAMSPTRGRAMPLLTMPVSSCTRGSSKRVAHEFLCSRLEALGTHTAQLVLSIGHFSLWHHLQDAMLCRDPKSPLLHLVHGHCRWLRLVGVLQPVRHRESHSTDVEPRNHADLIAQLHPLARVSCTVVHVLHELLCGFGGPLAFLHWLVHSLKS